MSTVAEETPSSWTGRIVWRKSLHSNPHGNCVELADLPDGRVAVRDSRQPHGTALTYPRTVFAAFLWGVKNGHFDGPPHSVR